MKTEISRTRYAILGTAILLAVLIAGCTGTTPASPTTPTATAPPATTTPAMTAAPTTVPTKVAAPSTTEIPTTPAATPTATATAAPTSPPGVAVTIQNFGFNPQVITVPAGTTVTWTNLDAVQHQVANSATNTAGPGQIFQSKILGKGDTYSYTFDTPGSYRYYCVIHPYMWGIVNVA